MSPEPLQSLSSAFSEAIKKVKEPVYAVLFLATAVIAEWISPSLRGIARNWTAGHHKLAHDVLATLIAFATAFGMLGSFFSLLGLILCYGMALTRSREANAQASAILGRGLSAATDGLVWAWILIALAHVAGLSQVAAQGYEGLGFPYHSHGGSVLRLALAGLPSIAALVVLVMLFGGRWAALSTTVPTPMEITNKSLTVEVAKDDPK